MSFDYPPSYPGPFTPPPYNPPEPPRNNRAVWAVAGVGAVLAVLLGVNLIVTAANSGHDTVEKASEVRETTTTEQPTTATTTRPTTTSRVPRPTAPADTFAVEAPEPLSDELLNAIAVAAWNDMDYYEQEDVCDGYHLFGDEWAADTALQAVNDNNPIEEYPNENQRNAFALLNVIRRECGGW